MKGDCISAALWFHVTVLKHRINRRMTLLVKWQWTPQESFHNGLAGRLAYVTQNSIKIPTQYANVCFSWQMKLFCGKNCGDIHWQPSP
jgi:hypothetical protein